jgi:hypothetical protein
MGHIDGIVTFALSIDNLESAEVHRHSGTGQIQWHVIMQNSALDVAVWPAEI